MRGFQPPSSTALDYFIVDVFTSATLAGNPLAVVMNTVGLASERMQAIAREFNLSETTFVERRSREIEESEGVRVRIFATQEELQFAGHPTLGTASVLKLMAPDTLRDGVITLAENAGSIPVRFLSDNLFGEMTQRDAEFGAELDPDEVARLCGLRATDLHSPAPPQVVSTGTAFAVVLLNSVESLGRLRVDHDRATPWLKSLGARWFYMLAATRPSLHPETSESPDFRARMQFYGGEDPATGSAAGCAIAFLVHKGIVPSERRVRLRQGVEISRASDLFVVAKALDRRVTEIRVGGSTVPVASGRLFLP